MTLLKSKWRAMAVVMSVVGVMVSGVWAAAITPAAIVGIPVPEPGKTIVAGTSVTLTGGGKTDDLGLTLNGYFISEEALATAHGGSVEASGTFLEGKTYWAKVTVTQGTENTWPAAWTVGAAFESISPSPSVFIPISTHGSFSGIFTVDSSGVSASMTIPTITLYIPYTKTDSIVSNSARNRLVSDNIVYSSTLPSTVSFGTDAQISFVGSSLVIYPVNSDGTLGAALSTGGLTAGTKYAVVATIEAKTDWVLQWETREGAVAPYTKKLKNGISEWAVDGGAVYDSSKFVSGDPDVYTARIRFDVTAAKAGVTVGAVTSTAGGSFTELANPELGGLVEPVKPYTVDDVSASHYSANFFGWHEVTVSGQAPNQTFTLAASKTRDTYFKAGKLYAAKISVKADVNYEFKTTSTYTTKQALAHGFKFAGTDTVGVTYVAAGTGASDVDSLVFGMIFTPKTPIAYPSIIVNAGNIDYGDPSATFTFSGFPAVMNGKWVDVLANVGSAYSGNIINDAFLVATQQGTVSSYSVSGLPVVEDGYETAITLTAPDYFAAPLALEATLIVNNADVVPGLLTGIAKPVLGASVTTPVRGAKIAGGGPNVDSVVFIRWSVDPLPNVAIGNIPGKVFSLNDSVYAVFQAYAKPNYAFTKAETEANVVAYTQGFRGKTATAGPTLGDSCVYADFSDIYQAAISQRGKRLTFGIAWKKLTAPAILADTIRTTYGSADSVTVTLRGVPPTARLKLVKTSGNLLSGSGKFEGWGSLNDSLLPSSLQNADNTVRTFKIGGLRGKVVNRDGGGAVSDSIIDIKVKDDVLLGGEVVLKTGGGAGVSLKVEPRSVKGLTATVTTEHTYTGSDVSLANVKVHIVNGKELVAGDSGSATEGTSLLTSGGATTTYWLKFKQTKKADGVTDTVVNSSEAGEVPLWIIAGGNLKDTIETSLTLAPWSISEVATANVGVNVGSSALTPKTYTGSALTYATSVTNAAPTFSVFRGTTSSPALVYDKDYDISYANNVGATQFSFASGTATTNTRPSATQRDTAVAVITGKGNYTGTARIPFLINKATGPTITGGRSVTVAYPATGSSINLETNALAASLWTVPAVAPATGNVTVASYTGIIGNRTYAIATPTANAGALGGGVITGIPEEGITYGIDVTTGEVYGGGNNVTAITTAVRGTLIVLPKNTIAIVAAGTPAVATPINVVAGKANVDLKVAVTYDPVKENVGSALTDTTLYYTWQRSLNGGAWTSVLTQSGTGGVGVRVKESILAIGSQSDLKADDVAKFRVVVEAKIGGASGTPIVAEQVTVGEWTVNVYGNTLTTSLGRVVWAGENVNWTNGGEFRYGTALPTVTINSGKEGVAGVASAWKVVALTYTGTDPARAAVTNNDPTGSLVFASTNGVKDPGTYDVSATLRNLDQASPGYGMEVVANKTGWKVNKRSLSATGLTIALSDVTGLVYNGTAAEPYVTVKDGTITLDEDVDYKIETAATDYKSAGTHKVKVTGYGNYDDKTSLEASFAIAKKAITLATGVDYGFEKLYDGKDTAFLAEGKEIQFSGLIEGDNLTLGTDYTITKLKYNNASVGTGKAVTATITLSGTSDNGKNYSLANGAFATTGNILKGPAVPENFKTTRPLPAEDLYTGKALGIGTVSWNGVTNAAISGNKEADGKFTVLYNGETALPIEIGDYAVTVNVNEGQSFLKTEDVALGTYRIVPALVPQVTASPADTSIRETFSVTLSATAKVDDGTATGTTKGITYQWLQIPAEGEATKVSGGTSASVTIKDLKEGSYTFAVEATYKNSNQATTVARSSPVTVTVLPAPVSLEAAVVRVTGEYTYTGKEQVVQDYDVTVTLPNGNPVAADYYTIESKSVAAGTGVVTVTGRDAYKGKATGTYVIAKKQLVPAEDLTYKPTNVYNATAQSAGVQLLTGLSGAGKITVLYDSTEAVPTNAGEWKLIVSVAEGSNLKGIDTVEIGTYRILQVQPTKELFNYKAPVDVAWDGQPHGVGEVTLKGPGVGYGELTVLYNGVEAEPVDSGVEYVVTLLVEGGVNYTPAVIELGRFTIHDEFWVSVASANREIPGSVTTETAVIAPVSKVTASLTVGPNPVASGSAMNIYWNGSKNVKGQLTVFGSTGKQVAKISVSGKGKIGAWNAKNAPEGTYLVKGVLKTDSGEKVKVSTLVGVAR